MKQAVVNGRWNLWLPDNIADWDAITGDYAARRGWEFERFESMHKSLSYDDILFDVGAEHGWISAILAREFVGTIVLFEPGEEMWVNIRKIWEHNNLHRPEFCFQGFVSDDDNFFELRGGWPKCANPHQPEVGGMPYKRIGQDAIQAISLDTFAAQVFSPTAVNIDVEGAELKVLRGATHLLLHDEEFEHVWVSVHPDLMARDFNTAHGDLHRFMADVGWEGEFLGEDHEQHWHYWRA